MSRLFIYDGRTFPDPDSRLTVDEVRRQLSDFFPELSNADTREERRGEDTAYTFARRIGTKGGGRRRRRPPDIVGILRRVPPRELRVFELEATIVLVGCGGTGGFVAETTSRLLLGRRAAFFMVDRDRVEPVNTSRQAFERSDVGRFKAEVLAERLARRFGREVAYSVAPYDSRVHAAAFDEPSRFGILVGAVDNASARAAIAATLAEPSWHSKAQPIVWLDAGNSRNGGRVLLGNATRRDHLHGAFNPATGLCHALPSLQRPDLLEAPPVALVPVRLDCARAVSEGEQGKTINQFMSALVTSYLERLLDGTCSWMATYADLDNGTMSCIPADPSQVAALTGVRPSDLVARVGVSQQT
jgi:PRTRC genetic system protein C